MSVVSRRVVLQAGEFLVNSGYAPVYLHPLHSIQLLHTPISYQSQALPPHRLQSSSFGIGKARPDTSARRSKKKKKFGIDPRSNKTHDATSSHEAESRHAAAVG